jgi:hypothetical protein
MGVVLSSYFSSTSNKIRCDKVETIIVDIPQRGIICREDPHFYEPIGELKTVDEGSCRYG